MLVMKSRAAVLAKRPSKPTVSAAVANLQRGGALILERVDEESGDWYVQVWMREDNTFQLEYRDGVPSEHYQTRTVSRDKVIAAMLGWMKGEPDWNAPFVRYFHAIVSITCHGGPPPGSCGAPPLGGPAGGSGPDGGPDGGGPDGRPDGGGPAG